MSLMTKDLLEMGLKQLTDAEIADAEIDARGLLCYACKWSGKDLFMRWADQVDDDSCERYFEMIARRASGRPMQYILGEQEFMGFKFKVNESVLIPRQDTEVLVETACKVIKSNNHRNPDKRTGKAFHEKVKSRKSWDVLDLGCGSGAIGVSIARLRKEANVTCSDVSNEAVRVAMGNADANGVGKSMDFLQSDMFSAFKKRQKFDMILTNPPYIKSDVIPTLQREIKEYEPLIALDGGKDGLDFYRRIVHEAPLHMQKGGVLIMEIGSDQAEDVAKLLKAEEIYTNITCIQDLAHLDRIICTNLKEK